MAAATAQAANHLIDLAESRLSFTTASSSALDSGAGSGVLTEALAKRFPHLSILACDLAPAMLAQLEAKKLPNVLTMEADACDVGNPKIQADTFSHVLSTFMIQFTGEPTRSLQEMHRVLRPGGIIALGSWIDIGINWPWEEACKLLDPDFIPQSPFAEGAWRSAEDVERAMQEVGFVDISSREVSVCLNFNGTEEFVEYWYSAKNPGMLKMQSAWKGDIEDVREMLKDVVKTRYGGGHVFPMKVALTIAMK
ncbi:hypothetical protein ACLMJK_004674 [Lecanora helva]